MLIQIWDWSKTADIENRYEDHKYQQLKRGDKIKYFVIEPVQHSGFQNLVAMATLALWHRGGWTEIWLGGGC